MPVVRPRRGGWLNFDALFRHGELYTKEFKPDPELVARRRKLEQIKEDRELRDELKEVWE